MVPKPVRNFFISLGVRQSIRIASLEQISHFTRPQTCQESLFYSQQIEGGETIPMLIPGVGGDLFLTPRPIPSTA